MCVPLQNCDLKCRLPNYFFKVSEDVSGQQIAECLSYLLHQFSATNDKGLVFQRVKQILAFITSQGNK